MTPTRSFKTYYNGQSIRRLVLGYVLVGVCPKREKLEMKLLKLGYPVELVQYFNIWGTEPIRKGRCGHLDKYLFIARKRLAIADFVFSEKLTKWRKILKSHNW